MLSHSLMPKLLLFWLSQCSWLIFDQSCANRLIMISFIQSARSFCAWHSNFTSSISSVTFLYSSLYFRLLCLSLLTYFKSSSFCIFKLSFSFLRMRSMFAYWLSYCSTTVGLRRNYSLFGVSLGKVYLIGLLEGFLAVLIERILSYFSCVSFMEVIEMWSGKELSPFCLVRVRDEGWRVDDLKYRFESYY